MHDIRMMSPCRSLAAADHVRDPQGSQAALSMTSTFAKEHRVDFLGLPLLPPSQQPEAATKVLPHQARCC